MGHVKGRTSFFSSKPAQIAIQFSAAAIPKLVDPSPAYVVFTVTDLTSAGLSGFEDGDESFLREALIPIRKTSTHEAFLEYPHRHLSVLASCMWVSASASLDSVLNSVAASLKVLADYSRVDLGRSTSAGISTHAAPAYGLARMRGESVALIDPALRKQTAFCDDELGRIGLHFPDLTNYQSRLHRQISEKLERTDLRAEAVKAGIVDAATV